MELNFKFYNEESDLFGKNENNIYEKQIVDILQNASSINYDEILGNDIYSKNVCKLSSINSNYTKWYDFKKDSSVLEISDNFGITLNEIKDRVKKVVSVISSKVVANSISRFFEKCNNVEIIVGNLKNIKFSEKFDYIVFSDEFANYMKDFGSDITNVLSYLKSLLKEDGKILFAIDNSLGIKYLAGASCKNSDDCFDNLTDGCVKVTKKVIEEALKNLGLRNYIFYYPLPDFNITNVIFSDKYLPKANMSKLMYNLNYTEGSNVVFSELKAVKNLVKIGEFSNFSNSFLVEISLDEDYENKIKFVSFNNLRKEEYRIMTRMFDTYVEKSAISDMSNNHIANMKKNIDILSNLGFNLLDRYESDIIISKYVKEDSLNTVILRELNLGNVKKAVEYIKNWYEYVYSLLIKQKSVDISNNIFDKACIDVDDSILNNMSFIKNTVIDLVFENTFYIDDKYYIYDQEWNYYNAPIEFILYRAINNLYQYDFNISNVISKEDLLAKFNIACFKEIFDKLEQYVQSDIIDSSRLEYYNRSYNYRVNIKEINKKNDDLKKEIENLKNNFSVKEAEYLNEIQRLNDRLNSIYNSKSWKIIERINKIRGKSK